MRNRFTVAGAVVAFVVALAIPMFAFGATPITAQMKGSNIVNASGGDPDGSASLSLRVNRVKNRVCYELGYKKLAKVDGAFVHKGTAGQVGRPIITLFEGRASTEGCVHGLRSRIVKRLKRKPSAHYADVTTKSYPNGAVRGQLSR